MPPPPKKKEKETIALFKRRERERRWFLVWRARELAASEVFFNKEGKQVFFSLQNLSLSPRFSPSLSFSLSLSLSPLSLMCKKRLTGKKEKRQGGRRAALLFTES
jgi:hypothetical protein